MTDDHCERRCEDLGTIGLHGEKREARFAFLALFEGRRIQSNFMRCVGTGKPESVFPRNPRLSFDEAGRFA
jgi:hypothetical protein